MANKSTQLIPSSDSIRWVALILISATMLSAYFFIEMMSPLKPLLESHYYWKSTSFELFLYSKYFLIALGVLFLFGKFTDKYGVRFIGLISTIMMMVGAWLNVYAFSPAFNENGIGYEFLANIFPNYPPSVVIAFIGFSTFGLGAEITSIISIKALTKWFSGKEIGFAIGFLIAASRLGGAFAYMLSANFAGFRQVFGLPHGNLLFSVYFGAALVFLGFLTFTTFSLFDSNYDLQNKENTFEKFSVKDKTKTKFSFTNLELLGNIAIFVFIYLVYSHYTTRISAGEIDTIHYGYSSIIYILKLLGVVILAPICGLFADKIKDTNLLLGAGIIIFVVSLVGIIFTASGTTLNLILISLMLFSYVIAIISIIRIITQKIKYNNLATALSLLFWIQTIFMLISLAL